MKLSLLIPAIFLMIAPASAQIAPPPAVAIGSAVLFEAPLPGLPGDEADPQDLALSIYPNPAVDETVVSFLLEEAQRVTIDVFDVLGRRVSQEELGYLEASLHEARLSVQSLPVGLYIVRLSGDSGARATVRITKAAGAS